MEMITASPCTVTLCSSSSGNLSLVVMSSLSFSLPHGEHHSVASNGSKPEKRIQIDALPSSSSSSRISSILSCYSTGRLFAAVNQREQTQFGSESCFGTGDKLSLGLQRVRVKVDEREWLEAEEPQPKPSPAFDPRAQELSELEWKEFEEAVNTKDLGRALKALEILSRFQSDVVAEDSNVVIDLSGAGDATAFVRADSSRVAGTSQSLFLPRGEYLKVLNTCQSAMDLQMVGQAYRWLQDRGLLQNFGKCKTKVFEAADGGRVVTAADMLASSGLDASSLSPKKWGLGGNSGIQLLAGIAIFSFLVNNVIDIRPLAVLIVGLSILDSIYLGGTGQAQVQSLWPPYKRRVLVHEAGHVLVAYLLGCPVRGIVLDAMEALKSGIAGQFAVYVQAGTQFWDESLEQELQENRLTGASLDRYCIVLFAGIAAEGLVYGEAEGGESDENLYKAVISELRPPWGPGRMSNHARWSVLQAFDLLKEYRKVHEAIVQALEQGSSLASLVNTIETCMAAQG